MKKFFITVADKNEFFARGKPLSALADAGKPIPSESVISFGDPADLLKMLHPPGWRSSALSRRSPTPSPLLQSACTATAVRLNAM